MAKAGVIHTTSAFALTLLFFRISSISAGVTILFCRGQALFFALLFPLAFMLEQLYRQECLGFSNTTGRLKKQNQLLGRILLFIEENLNRSFTIEELCSAFHCSRSYISHLFCSSTGHSFPEYLNLLRMEEARKLLAQTDFPITEIALKTGFSSSSYFSSLFRRMNGMSPSTYRNLRTLSPKEK